MNETDLLHGFSRPVEAPDRLAQLETALAEIGRVADKAGRRRGHFVHNDALDVISRLVVGLAQDTSE